MPTATDLAYSQIRRESKRSQRHVSEIRPQRNGDPGKIRTSDTQFRKLLLYPPELRGHVLKSAGRCDERLPTLAGSPATISLDYLFILEIPCSIAVSIKTNSNVPGIANATNHGKTLGSFNTPEPSNSKKIRNGPVTIRSLTYRC
jgi:hypothetical protein